MVSLKRLVIVRVDGMSFYVIQNVIDKPRCKKGNPSVTCRITVTTLFKSLTLESKNI